METTTSERSFRRGLGAIERRRYLEALAYFEAAVRLARRRGADAIPMRYVSYYGWSMAVCSGSLQEARALCEVAVRGEFFNPDLYWNLGRVCLRSGDRSSAFGAFVQGLRLNPGHAGLLGDLRRLGLRRRPVLPFFGRGNPLNRVLGMLRGALN